MSEEQITHSINLVGGYKDGQDVAHREVVFGHRITAKEMLDLDNNPLAANPTQRASLVLIKEITKFGSLKTPVPLSVLLDLVDVDRDDLMQAQNEFAEKTSEGRTIQMLSDSAKLGWGFKINDVLYPLVEFGSRNTGRDQVEADRLGLEGLSRECFLIGRQISKIKSADNAAVIDGPISLEKFSLLEDAMDITVLRGAAYLWRQSFRFTGETVSRNGGSAHGADPGDADRLERAAHSGSAGGTA